MSKKHKRQKPVSVASAGSSSSGGAGGKVAILVFAVALVAGGALLVGKKETVSSPGGATTNAAATTSNAPLPTNQVAQSLMVTVELDFGGKPPSMSEALKQIERRSEPEDGVGRTFAILDADGNVTPDGKLHIQMHLSMEKPGVGTLTFRRTGEVLWKSKIVAAPTGPPPPKRLTILMDDLAGKSVMLDGSKGASKVLDTPVNNSPSLVRDLWPEGAEHEFTFIYSVCGCPVKAKVRRLGESTARTTELPVMFPDDQDALRTIHQLMGWPAIP